MWPFSKKEEKEKGIVHNTNNGALYVHPNDILNSKEAKIQLETLRKSRLLDQIKQREKESSIKVGD